MPTKPDVSTIPPSGGQDLASATVPVDSLAEMLGTSRDEVLSMIDSGEIAGDPDAYAGAAYGYGTVPFADATRAIARTA